MDLRKLSSWSSRAGQLAKSRHWPRPPSGVVQGRVLDDEDDDEEVVDGSVLLGSAISTLLPELIFSDVLPVLEDELD